MLICAGVVTVPARRSGRPIFLIDAATVGSITKVSPRCWPRPKPAKPAHERIPDLGHLVGACRFAGRGGTPATRRPAGCPSARPAGACRLPCRSTAPPRSTSTSPRRPRPWRAAESDRRSSALSYRSCAGRGENCPPTRRRVPDRSAPACREMHPIVPWTGSISIRRWSLSSTSGAAACSAALAGGENSPHPKAMAKNGKTVRNRCPSVR